MTEENQDSPPRKLRLSREPNKAEAGNQAKPGEAPEAKPDLKLRRPEEKSEQAPTPSKQAQGDGDQKTGSKPVGDPKSTDPERQPKQANQENGEQKGEKEDSGPPADLPLKAKSPSVGAADDRPFDPEAPFAPSDVQKPRDKSQPPELPGKPAPGEADESGRKVEEAIDGIGEQKNRHGILTSIITIVILLVVLGGSGYGLYYLLSNPAESSDAATSPKADADADEASSEDIKSDSDGLLSGPIAKAKSMIKKKEETAANWEEEQVSAPAEEAPSDAPAEGSEEPELAEKVSPTTDSTTKAEKSPPAIDSFQTDSVSRFLRDAHIGGVRTGDQPKLILNGTSYNQGDLIDADTSLRFIGFRDEKLAFRDAQGVVYIKSF